MNKNKLLTLHDSPTHRTGFAEVGRNFLNPWRNSGFFDAGVDVWGIGYNGWPHSYPYRIFPCARDYFSSHQLSLFLRLLEEGEYTHVWLMQDLFNLSIGNFPEQFKSVCKKKGIKSFIYFPVDSPPEAEWTKILEVVDVPVAYCEYGRSMAADLCGRRDIIVLPHGADTTTFYPLPNTDRQIMREKILGDWVKPSDCVILNVNTHSRRKAPVNTLQILANLIRAGLPVKLVMHMPEYANDDGTSLIAMSKQLGLTQEHWRLTDQFAPNEVALLTRNQLNLYYNVSDLYLSTSYGEGWGLPATESMAAGCPVILPDHTNCREFAETSNNLMCQNVASLLPLSRSAVALPHDLSRVRYPVDVEASTSLIASRFFDGTQFQQRRVSPSTAWRYWLNWDRVAAEWLHLFKTTVL